MGQSMFDPTRTSEKAEFTPGLNNEDHLGHVYRYVQAGVAIAAHSAVAIDEDEIARGTTAVRGGVGDRVGVPSVAIPNQHYGWVSIYGKGTLLAAAGCAPRVALHTTAAGGILDDDTSGELITGIALTEARGSEAATAAQWSYPRYA